MRHPVMGSVAQEHHLLSDSYREVAMPPMRRDYPKIQQVQRGAGSKRAAPEPLEQSTSKAAKLTTNDDDEAFSEVEVKRELDEKDEMIAKLKMGMRNAREKIDQLEIDLEEAEDARRERQMRCHVLETREQKRLEKEKVVETDMTSQMKVAGKKLENELKGDYAQREKKLKQKQKEEKENMTADHKLKMKKQHDSDTARHQKEKKELQDKLKKKDDEMKQLKATHREEVKSYKPERSQSLKDKAKELKAKDDRIDRLIKKNQEMNAAMVEKESLANQLEEARKENQKLNERIERHKRSFADAEGQYYHDMEQASQKWQIQNDIAEDAKAKLMFQQRANFALRAETTHKVQRIQSLEQQLQVAQARSQVSTTDASAQTSTSMDGLNVSDIENQDSEVRKIDNSSPAAEVTVDQTMSETVGLETGPERTE